LEYDDFGQLESFTAAGYKIKHNDDDTNVIIRELDGEKVTVDEDKLREIVVRGSTYLDELYDELLE